MTPIHIDLGRQQIVITSDPRSDEIWLQLQAYGGTLGVSLTKKQAVQIRNALFQAMTEK